MSNQIIQLFSCLTLTKGISRALITDNQRGKYYTIPLSLYTLLHTYANCTINELLALFTEQGDRDVLKEYLHFLFENELIFSCNKEVANCFPSINTQFQIPALITNAIIIIDKFDSTYISNIIVQLEHLQCMCYEVNITTPINNKELLNFLDLCKYHEIEELNLFLCFNLPYTSKDLVNFYPFLNSVTIYNSNVDNEEYHSNYRFRHSNTTKDLSKVYNCGIVSTRYFTINIPHYTESLHHNTCLNRKIAIDAEGNIKNCPSMKESFGNIKDTTLEEAINKPGFKKYWNIKKDEITKCKDCEFRHICTDCRAYIDNPEDMYSAPLKCGYDPYTCEWEEWSTNPLKQKAIDYYEMRDLVKNEK